GTRRGDVSRYVQLTLALSGLDAVEEALRALGIPFERPGNRVSLRGSLECAGEPVDIRIEAGTLDAVEDFGFVVDASEAGPSVRLVCGELDRAILQERLVGPVLQHAAAATVERAAAREGLDVTRERSLDGTERIVIKRRR